MPYSRRLTGLACAVALALGAASAQAADPVLEVTGTLDASNLSDTYTFNISSAGTYVATLVDNALFVPFTNLGLGVTQTGGATMGSITGPGSFAFDVSAADSFTAVVGGVVPSGASLPIGTYGVTVALIPEPETWAMMLVGMGLVGWQLRRKVKSSAAGRFV